MSRRPYETTLRWDRELARRCRSVYEVSEDFGLFEVDTVTDGAGTTLIFAGSKNVVDWTFNLRFGMGHAPDLGGWIHGGFADLWGRGATSVILHMRRAWTPGTPLTIAGHSLGGALATIVAAEFRRIHPGESIDLVTFGAPRVFSTPALRRLGARVAGRHYLLGVDPIPHLPSWRPWRRYASLPNRIWLRRPAGTRGRDGWPSLWQRLPILRDHAIGRYEDALDEMAGLLPMTADRVAPDPPSETVGL
ncbi:lipase family protein [Tautonia sp. JC769]|uniref:lipase family protein n=1 Tax=Tautonia sp. JC769 TaxID=3232135 RepID=UPI003459A2E3